VSTFMLHTSYTFLNYDALFSVSSDEEMIVEDEEFPKGGDDNVFIFDAPSTSHGQDPPTKKMKISEEPSDHVFLQPDEINKPTESCETVRLISESEVKILQEKARAKIREKEKLKEEKRREEKRKEEKLKEEKRREEKRKEETSKSKKNIPKPLKFKIKEERATQEKVEIDKKRLRERKVEKIIGFADHNGKLHLLVKFKNHPNPKLVANNLMRELFPQDLIDFYEVNVKWDPAEYEE
jgi:hypothetical protein